ncbi:MAG: hypothetical protein Q9200_007184 [Gallowayella weberi]
MPCTACPSSDDSVLSTIASISGILTITYAVIVGILYYHQLFKDSVREIEDLLKSTEDLEIEILASPLDLDTVLDLASTPAGPRLTKAHRRARRTAAQQINDLEELADQFSKGRSNFQRLRYWSNYLIDKKNLTQKRAAVDKAVEKTRYAAVMFERCADSFYRQQQKKALREQYKILEHQTRLLESLSSRLIGMEKAVTTIKKEVQKSDMSAISSGFRPPRSHWF